MNLYQMLLCAALSLGLVGAGAFIDYRNLERDRAARTTDFSSPATLLTGRAKREGDATKVHKTT